MPPKAPALDVIRECPRAVILGSGLRLGENISYYIITTFSITYLTEVAAESHSLALNAILIGAIVQFFAIPLLALLSYKTGRRPVYARSEERRVGKDGVRPGRSRV